MLFLTDWLWDSRLVLRNEYYAGPQEVIWMSAEEFTESVVQVERLLRHVAFIIKRRGRDILNDFDITTPQFLALLVLKEHQG